MTVAVAGCWELGWNTPIKECDLWLFPLRDFKVDLWFMAPISGIDAKVVELATMDEILEANSDLVRVYVDENASVRLEDFEHPVNAIYVFGKASYSPYRASKPRSHDLAVHIMTPANLALLWAHQAATVMLYDRFLKRSR